MFKKITLNDTIYKYSIVLIIALFAISKISYLTLPFYWDEAWSYAVAIFDMHDHGISLIPGSVNTELTRGHPLLYYVTASIWTKIVGTSLLSMHSFALLISCVALYAIFKLSVNLFNVKIAIVATILLAFQYWFWVQSTFLLPEIFLMLLFLLSINAYFTQQWLLFTFWTSCIVLTKETGWVILIAFILDYISITLLLNKTTLFKKKWKYALYFSIPITILSLFLIIQKIKLGWFFYPEHIEMMHLNTKEIYQYFKLICKYFFINDNHFILLLFSVISLSYILYKKKKIQNLHFILFSYVVIFVYISFSTINFFTTRYLLCILPLFILTSTYLVYTLFQERNLYFYTIFSLFLINNYFNSNIIYNQDVYNGFKESILVQKQAIRFCESQKWYNESIKTGFLQYYNMNTPRLGYLKDSTIFKNINGQNPKIYYFYSCEFAPQNTIDSLNNDTTMIKIKRYEKNKAWAEIYCKKSLITQK